MSRINTLDNRVRTVLADDEPSRNSDIRLTQMIWWKYHRHSLLEQNGTVYVDMKKLFDLPREDNIKRIRAKIQNVEKKFLPTNAEVAKKRGWQIEEWREYLGHERLPEYL